MLCGMQQVPRPCRGVSCTWHRALGCSLYLSVSAVIHCDRHPDILPLQEPPQSMCICPSQLRLTGVARPTEPCNAHHELWGERETLDTGCTLTPTNSQDLFCVRVQCQQRTISKSAQHIVASCLFAVDLSVQLLFLLTQLSQCLKGIATYGAVFAVILLL